MAQQTESNVTQSLVRRVQFGILSPDEVKRMSVTEGGVIYPESQGTRFFSRLWPIRFSFDLIFGSPFFNCARNLMFIWLLLKIVVGSSDLTFEAL